jgi:peptidoglycan/LPS O-acetylase OafA/YrhL
MTWVGQISYGVYVFHAFALLLDRVGLRALPPLARFPVYAAFTLVVSALSWRWFESRVNAWKSRFPYRRRDEPAAEARRAA